LLNIATTTNNGNPTFRISGGTGTGANVGQIDFYSNAGSAVVSSVKTTRDGGDSSGALAFFTAASGTNTERMRIDTSGNVGIGLSNPAVKTDINGVMRAATWSLTGTGVTGGTTAFSAGTVSTDSNWGMYFRAPTGSAAIANYSFRDSADTALMTIDSSGNVGIGTSSPSTKLDVAFAGGMMRAGGSAGNNLIQAYTGSVGGGIWAGGVTRFYSTGSMTLSTNATIGTSSPTGTVDAVTIDTSGNLLVGTTSYAAGQNSIKLNGSSSNFSRSSTAASAQIYFENPNGTVGQISTSGSATSYLTSSDYRLKEDVEALTSGLSTVSAMRPVSYKWKVDGGVGNGFIAHELQAIVPDAVSGEKDAVNEDGSIKPQGVDYSKIVVHLVAAIQELSAKNDALEARLAVLETPQPALPQIPGVG
jgi:hypothetical protein